jgi:dihydrofolate reductase
MKKFSLIIACSCNGGIGFKNNLPWNIPEDLKNFKNITSTVIDKNKTNAIVMGRNTWESLPKKPLPNRKNMVLTLNPEYELGNKAIILNSIDDIFIYCSDKNIETIFIIGGAEIYKECLNNYKKNIDKIYLTVVIDKYYECDKFINLDNILLNYIYLIATNNN